MVTRPVSGRWMSHRFAQRRVLKSVVVSETIQNGFRFGAPNTKMIQDVYLYNMDESSPIEWNCSTCLFKTPHLGDDQGCLSHQWGSAKTMVFLLLHISNKFTLWGVRFWHSSLAPQEYRKSWIILKTSWGPFWIDTFIDDFLVYRRFTTLENPFLS